MRRFILVATLLIVSLAMWAAPLTYNGQLTFGVIGNGDVIHDSYANNYIYLYAKPSDSTTVTVRADANFRAADLHASLTRFYVTQDVTAFFKADPKVFKALVSMGVLDFVSAYYAPSDFGMEAVGYVDTADMDMLKVETKIADKLAVNVGFSPGALGGFDWVTNPPRLAASVAAPIGPVNVAAFYYSNGKALEDGLVGGSVGFGFPVGKVNVYGDIEGKGDLSAVGDGALVYGAALGAGYKWISGTLSGYGNLGGPQCLGADLQITPIKWFGLNIGAAFNPQPSAVHVVDSAEFGGWVSLMDGLKFRFGYTYTETACALASMYVPNPPTEGGAWLKLNIAF